MLKFQVKVYLGTHHTTSSEESIPVKNISFHHTWDGEGRYGYNHSDSAILTLAHPVTFTDKIRPLCLPADVSLSYAGETATAAGWGKTQTGSGSPVLKKVQVNIISNDQCNQPSSYDLCAFGKQDDNFGTRPGDSGSLLFLMENER